MRPGGEEFEKLDRIAKAQIPNNFCAWFDALEAQYQADKRLWLRFVGKDCRPAKFAFVACLWGPDIFVEARVEYAQGGLRRSTLGQCHLDELLYCFRSIREKSAGSRFTPTVWLQDGWSNDLPSTSTDDS
jgi:hypothetical protein